MAVSQQQIRLLLCGLAFMAALLMVTITLSVERDFYPMDSPHNTALLDQPRRQQPSSSSATTTTTGAATPIPGRNHDNNHAMLKSTSSSSSSIPPPTVCRPNAIVYLAQKHHPSYDRDSYGLLLKSLDLLVENYLSRHGDNATVFIFHTGDFDPTDLAMWRQRYQHHPSEMIDLQLRNIVNTSYWQLPDFLQNEDPKDWFLPDYTVGYRHMMRWYALKLYQYLRNEEEEQQQSIDNKSGKKCHYEYVMRMDEESFLHSPIDYDVFAFMAEHGYDYGFRQCSFEMRHMKPLWNEYRKDRPDLQHIEREFLQAPVNNNNKTADLCGFYNNWFIGRIDIFLENPSFLDWLEWMDNSGYIYRKRVNDLIIHTAGVYAFVPTHKIHRFLDFTYEHFTNYKKSGCPLWGALSGGYNDPHALERVQEYVQRELKDKGCPKPYEKKPYFPRILNLTAADLSPTYSHLPDGLRETLSLPTVAAGHVDLGRVGLRSG